jgi:hypothetical protein
MPPDETAPPPAAGPPAPAGDNDVVNQVMQWLRSTAAGGGGGGSFGGSNPMAPMDPLGLGMGGMGGMGDPLAMAGMLNPSMGGIGLNPYQAAGLRLRRNNEMNALRQSMANAHRGVGRFGGRDFSRHVQNIDDEMMALQEQKVQDNIKTALAYNDQLMRYGQQNLANNQALGNKFAEALANMFRYGGTAGAGGSPGTFSGAEGGDQGGADTQGTLP